jgi:hypothetical protein
VGEGSAGRWVGRVANTNSSILLMENLSDKLNEQFY